MTRREFKPIWEESMRYWDKLTGKRYEKDTELAAEFFNALKAYPPERVKWCFAKTKSTLDWPPKISQILSTYRDQWPPEVITTPTRAKSEAMCERERDERMELAFKRLPVEEQAEIRTRVRKELAEKLKNPENLPPFLEKVNIWIYMRKHFVFVDGEPRRKEE